MPRMTDIYPSSYVDIFTYEVICCHPFKLEMLWQTKNKRGSKFRMYILHCKSSPYVFAHRMGNNNWLKQSLLWENKRAGHVASEGQAWWHSEHLNSHWLPGSGGCRAPPGALLTGTDLRGRWGWGEDASPSQLPLPALRSRLFPLRCHGSSDSRTPWGNCRKVREKCTPVLDCVFLLLGTIAPWPWLMSQGLLCMLGTHADPCLTCESSSTLARPL